MIVMFDFSLNFKGIFTDDANFSQGFFDFLYVLASKSGIVGFFVLLHFIFLP